MGNFPRHCDTCFLTWMILHSAVNEHMRRHAKVIQFCERSVSRCESLPNSILGGGIFRNSLKLYFGVNFGVRPV